MKTSDSISDLLTHLRNAMRSGHEKAQVDASRQREAIVKLLAEEGYVAGYKTVDAEPQNQIQVRLKYDGDGEPVIGGIQRVSKPGRRVYRRASEIQPVLGGLGIAVVSTSRGLMTDRQARERKLGGEILFNVW
ncbi:MAG TPA: 30S ribosomal protein S8 [Thermoanaerobaculia bacterium]|nr:30S ribosomal protein S8 [Thermoanaerobaculia bacterium]